MRRTRWWPAVLLTALGCAGCGDGEAVPDGKPAGGAPAAGPVSPVAPAVPEPGVPPERVDELLASMNRGVAFLERYDYGSAAEELRAAVEVAPGFYPARINLGIALLNTQKAPAEAEEHLRVAAALEPDRAAAPYLLGILYAEGWSPPRDADALEAFRRAVARAPDDADAHHRLGTALRGAGDGEAAEVEFSRAVDLNPFLGAALYQRGLNRRRLGREEEGLADLRRFQALEQARAVDAREVTYGGMGDLARAVTDLDPWLPPATATPPATVVLVDAEDVLDDPRDPGGTLALEDVDGDGLPDLVFGGASAGWRENLGGWKFGPRHAFPTATPAGDLCVADLDSDGVLDVVRAGAGVGWGAFGDTPDWSSPDGFPPGAVRLRAADVDADGDLDLLAGRTVLLGDGRRSFTPAEVAWPDDADWTPLFLIDVDDDGFPDLGGADTWVRNLRGGRFGGERAYPDALRRDVRAAAEGKLMAVGDIDADGLDDRVFAIGDGATVERGRGTAAPAGGMPHGGAWAVPEARGNFRAGILADMDGDGDLDLLLAQGGRLRFLVNAGDAGPRMLHLELKGVLHPNGRQFGWTNPRGLGVRIDVVRGRFRQSRTMGLGLGLDGRGPVHTASFGLGPEARADLVSLRWTEGVIQAEPEVAAGRRVIEEVQRKAASCPVVFTWDGEGFAFIADCMGGGGLGFLVAPGVFGPPDPTERVFLPGDRMVPRDGAWEVRLHEPLEEVVYADHLALVALDRPAGMAVVPDERFGGEGPPPGDRVYVFPESGRRLPRRATDLAGADVRPALAENDGRWADGFALHRDLVGFTEEPHGVVLDFGDGVPAVEAGERLLLVLDGWIEYGYSRTFYAASGARVECIVPRLDVPDGEGGWRTLVHDLGYPAGTPRTMTVDVTDVLGPDTPVFRIVTNLEIYWDRISLAVDRGEDRLVRTRVAPATAELRFAGFPAEVPATPGSPLKIHDYQAMKAGQPGFKTLRGAYTRFGDVRELLAAADDRFVVFRNGEEIVLRFPVEAFPPLPEGWVRDFMLETDGWCKDMDPYTATPDTVTPLPWHGMSTYPPPEGETYPAELWEWRARFNTR